MKNAIFPGSFDPFHEGHKYLIDKALEKYEIIYIIISWNENKKRKYSYKQSKKMIEKIYKNNDRIKIIINEKGFISDLVNELNCFTIIRGIRNEDDKKYEKELKKQYLRMNNKIKIEYFYSPNNLKNIRSSNLKIRKN